MAVPLGNGRMSDGRMLLAARHPFYVLCLPAGWETTVVDARSGSEFLVPGTHPDDHAARVSSWAPTLVLRPDRRAHIGDRPGEEVYARRFA